ncbi:MAG: pullulanase-type alpha-1,6-glucosidase [Balneolaceae bacterium]|nr:MAG: pullulanase-type alpha-1,6-glucosidase [Balneolaceae bacterium]
MKRYLIVLLFFLPVLTGAAETNIFDEERIFSGAEAHWIASDKLIWNAPLNAERVEIRYSLQADIRFSDDEVTGGEIIKLEPGAALTRRQSDKFRHISDRRVFRVNSDTETIRQAVKGQVVAIAYDNEDRAIYATRVQFPGIIDELFSYDGILGPAYHEEGIDVKLWAPTAQSVSITVYNDSKNPVGIFQADEIPENGVWHFRGPEEWDRMFYRFTVEVYHHINNEINRFEVTDPYSVSLSTDSYYSQFADLKGDESLKPAGWDEIRKVQPRPVDISIYETHIRDFSIIDTSVHAGHRGTYMAFTHNGIGGDNLSKGMNHLIQLAEAGLTHLHLLPINDIASVNENPANRIDLHHPYSRICGFIEHEELTDACARYGDTPIREVFEMLADEDPVTEKIQKPYNVPGRMNGLAAYDGFNWGYDPFHFNAPEGSYATDPEGAQRILEVREMVKALHEAGLKVVIDVVYNHTFASGTSRFSVLDKVVPGYYHRYNPNTGEMETSTCCDNTAAEHAMMEKLLIDSVILWARYYKIDSFRFDLMGHHPRYVMENLQKALAMLTLEEHGVDGANLYIYGEGWNFGEVADNRIFEQATQFNMGGTGIGNFNDRIRDAIRGGFFSWSGREQGFANGRYLFPNEDDEDNRSRQLEGLLSQADRIRVGMAGNMAEYPYLNRFNEVVTGSNEYIGYTLLPQESVNYIDKHDNETLWDNTQAKLPFDLDMDSRLRIHLLSTAFINYGQGVPFHQLGTDILRSKSMDRNSFDSGDWFNSVDFSLETNNWAIGLPPAWDNSDRWDEHRIILSNPQIEVIREHMEFTNAVFREQLSVRYSSPLFRLETAEEIKRRVKFHNTGPDQVPGIIAMSISDGTCAGETLDEYLDGILVLFNSDLIAQQIHIGIRGLDLHPVLAEGTDTVLHNTSISNGTITIPAHSAVVLIKRQDGEQGSFPCNPFLESE